MANLLKEDTLAMLQEVLQDGLKEVIQAYVSDAPKRIADIQLGVKALDMVAVEASAHALKGSSANIGAIAVSESAEELVVMCRNQTLTIDDGKSILTRMSEEFQQTKTRLLEYI